MSNELHLLKLHVETTLLVAVWAKPMVFQGYIEIHELQRADCPITFYFRSQAYFDDQHDLLNQEFSNKNYELTHLYHHLGLISLDVENDVQCYALDMLQYAVHTTVKAMLCNKPFQVTAIDEIAMQTMINQVKPVLNLQQDLGVAKELPVGFATAMNFTPQENMGYLAANMLLNSFGSVDSDSLH